MDLSIISITKIFPNIDKSLLELIDKIMVYSPLRRATAIEVLSLGYFDELRDEITFRHIAAQYNLKDFFHFTPEELQGQVYLVDRLIPIWLRRPA